MVLTQNQILYGSNNNLPEQVLLRAGALKAYFEDGTLRHIKLGDTLVLHQIYAAVRDHNWGTIPARLSDVTIDAGEDSFSISFVSHHQQGHIDFVWQGIITGDSSGTIRFHFDGQANSTFDKNRIGFCVLHPTNCAGLPCSVEHVDGSVSDGIFPEYISPHQPFFDIRAITHPVEGVDIRVLMEGDTFEMEDQRNWSDASYKTYCTPLGLPFPVTIEKGDRIQQTITLSLHGDTNLGRNNATPSPVINVGATALGTCPPIGLGIPALIPALTNLQVKRLSSLHLDHLRIDLHVESTDWQDMLKRAKQQATDLNCQLEIAVHLTDEAESQLVALKHFNQELKLPVARWIIFHKNEKSTSEKWVQLARQYLSDAPIGAGTDAFFTELNRERPPVDAIDFAVYSTNPQVHAFDNTSLIETLAVQRNNVISARHFCGGKPIVVSPITLKMRFNPNATGDPSPTHDSELPSQVDARQMSLLGACWTLGSLKNNIESQVESITYYETIGWRGVMDSPDAPQQPDKFPSIANAVFPMYHVFADIGELAGAYVIQNTTSNHLMVDSLALKQDDKLTILVANMTPDPQTIALLIPHGQYTIRRLNHENAIEAMTNPESYRMDNILKMEINETSNTLTASPYEYIRLRQA